MAHLAAAASAAARRAAEGLRAAVGQLRQDAQDVHWRDVAQEFAPKRMWREFRGKSVRTQAFVAITAYTATTTGMMYGYLRYSRSKALRQHQLVLKAIRGE
mmetsp:Transcript_126835/g.406110  ORF Transcript_126835/g.406110 Transcript_126835/m.406110 type:complete len:101 (-) Transcript_126835:84-386(-)